MKDLNIYRRQQQQNRNYTPEIRLYNGARHVVVPVVMMVEGVHSGSRGPLFHSALELGRVVGAWNGIPVTLRHPEVNGQFVSANTPEQLQQSIGRVFNARMDGAKLKAEAWINEAALQTMSPQALQAIRQGQAIDVSVGVFSDEEVVEGSWNGENYTAIARNHRPDHLALLPGEQGACSWADGCGIRVNSNNSNDVKTMEDQGTFSVFKKLKEDGYIVSSLVVNEVGMQEILSKARSAIDAMDNDFRICFLEELYQSSVIFRIRSRNSNGMSNGNSEHWYQQSYSLDDSGNFSLTGEPVEVARTVSYNPLNTNNAAIPPIQRTKFNSNSKTESEMSQNTVPPCIAGRVDRLISNAAMPFSESDRDWLSVLSEGQLDTLGKIAPVTQPVSTPAANMQVNEAMELVRANIKKPEDALQLLSADVRDAYTQGLALFTEQKKALADSIIANTDQFTSEELAEMSFNMLQKIANSVGKKDTTETRGADYSGLGANGAGGNTPQKNAPEILMPFGI